MCVAAIDSRAVMASKKRQRGSDDDETTHVLECCHNPTSTPALAELWRADQLCDVEITAGGESFRAHKIVLAAGSDFFRALFTTGSGMRDGGTRAAIIDVEPAALRDVLTFLYDMKLTVTPVSLAPVMRAASRLEVPALLKLSAGFLQESLTIDTCIASWSVARLLERPELDGLWANCEQFAAHHFCALTLLAEFVSLTRPQFAGLLARDDLCATEQSVFLALQKWLEAQEPPPDDAAKLELFSLIRYPFMASEFLAEVVEKVLTLLPGGKDLLFEAYRYKALPAKLQASFPDSPRIRPRLFLPRGVQLDLPDNFLVGWTKQWEKPHSHVTTAEEIESIPAEATHVFVGARDKNGKIVLGACGRREAVLQRTRYDDEAAVEDGVNTHEDNGVYWYFAFDSEDEDEGMSFGFSRVPSVLLTTADTLGLPHCGLREDEDGKYRLSWHITGDMSMEDGGYRVGHFYGHIEPEGDEKQGTYFYGSKLLYWITLP